MARNNLHLAALPFSQGTSTLYLTKAFAHELWNVVQINQRVEDKDEGYQRALSVSRVRAISRYIDSGNPLAPAVIITFDQAEYDSQTNELILERRPDAGWVIDGQHRLAGCAKADSNIEIPVIAFIGLGEKEQIEQFVTINREAKGVPTSLYYDLLKHLPSKKPNEIAKERASDIAYSLRTDEESIFFNRIVITNSPKSGELSLTNVVRKITPLIQPGKGAFGTYNVLEQRKIIDNYFKGIRNVYYREFERPNSKIFKTLGFGALINALPTVFSICFTQHHGFTVDDVTKTLKAVEHFDFGSWDEMGSGSAAEIQAGKDFEEELRAAYTDGGDDSTIRL